MGIFRDKKKELPPLFSEAELDGATYDQVIEFLTAVNDKDYFKIIQVAEATRIHNAGVAKITGMKPEPVPSIFERQTAQASTLLDDDDLSAAFLEDDEPAITKSGSKPKKIDVKGPKDK